MSLEFHVKKFTKNNLATTSLGNYEILFVIFDSGTRRLPIVLAVVVLAVVVLAVVVLAVVVPAVVVQAVVISNSHSLSFSYCYSSFSAIIRNYNSTQWNHN